MSDLLLPFVFIENRLAYFVVPWGYPSPVWCRLFFTFAGIQQQFCGAPPWCLWPQPPADIEIEEEHRCGDSVWACFDALAWENCPLQTHLLLIHYLLAIYPRAHLLRWQCAWSQALKPAPLNLGANHQWANSRRLHRLGTLPPTLTWKILRPPTSLWLSHVVSGWNTTTFEDPIL